MYNEHAAWIAVVAAVAADEGTALFLPDGGAPVFEVRGSGSCWDIRRTRGRLEGGRPDGKRQGA
ncbi:hypothetical protein QFZ36_001869 [Pseudarthrobacter siccitolerans]|uniref:Uncharacterized protein n=1 Tax=Pseudarthrobacter siccitolerans TaxID=861266 RepID=A0ABU0PK07_9MICC|nr:hypothetical protein [Pseudarthrobacter siccitolerans]MDQ0674308.1 hypothetical protein [Pseudarthrobacter siccitolerans]